MLLMYSAHPKDRETRAEAGGRRRRGELAGYVHCTMYIRAVDYRDTGRGPIVPLPENT